MYKSQNNYAEQKRLDPSPLPEIKRTREQTYCMITFVENYRKCKVIHSDRKQINECLPRLGRSGGELGEGGITKDMRELSGAMDVFILLIVVMVS